MEKLALRVFSLITLLFIPLGAQAYIGPGVGLTAIGSFIALLFIVILALIGFFWYPIKRFLKKREDNKIKENDER